MIVERLGCVAKLSVPAAMNLLYGQVSRTENVPLRFSPSHQPVQYTIRENEPILARNSLRSTANYAEMKVFSPAYSSSIGNTSDEYVGKYTGFTSVSEHIFSI